MVYDCPEKRSLNWKGWKTCWLPTANKTSGPEEDFGVFTVWYNSDCYIYFLCSYCFQLCSSVLLLITLPYTQFLTWISKYSSKCTWPLCWNRAEKSTLLWYRKLKYSKYWANFFLCHILDEYYFFFSIILGNLKSITGFEKKCVVVLLLLFSPGETSSFQQISHAVLW